MKTINLFVLLLVLAPLGGCVSSTPMKFSGNSFVAPDAYSGRSKPEGVEKAESACDVRVGNFVDKRSDRSSLGSVAGRPLQAKNLGDMVEQGYRHHLSSMPSIRLVDDSSAEVTTPVVVEGEILKAYMHSIATSMAANVALRIRLSNGGETADEHIVRGRDTSLNWASGDGELQEGLSAAMLQAAEQTTHWIEFMCHQQQMNRDVTDSSAPTS